ncbi:MAG: RNA polymerase sigma factor [Lachnospiraceae bacterium]
MFLLSMADAEDQQDRSQNEQIEKYLRRIARGHTEAVGDVYELTKSAVYGYVLSILKNAEDAEDILQETYVKICLNAESYHSQGKPMAWIFTIARNLALMKLRGQSRIADIPEFEWEQIAAGNHEFQSEDRIVLSAALTQISEEESQIIMLHAVGGMKHREIAEWLGMPLATVLSKYHRAIRKLQKILDEEDGY